MKNSKIELIKLLKDNNVVKFGKFTLSSGKESDFYVDMKGYTVSLPEEFEKSRRNIIKKD